MKSFTADIGDGRLARVRIPDDQAPSVISGGVILAEGVPTTVGTALRFTGLTATPVGTAVVRHVNRVHTGSVEVVDVDADYGSRYLAIPGLPVLWGAKFLRTETRVRGWTFEAGQAEAVEWEVDLVKVKRRCGACGG